MANVGIIGYGVVGSALGETLKRKHKVFAFDVNKSVGNREDVYSNCKYIFFCVPTPEANLGGLDMSIMNQALDHALKLKDKVFVIRSTVTPGYTAERQKADKNNRYIFCPEFLVERNAKACTANPEVLVCGADNMELCRTFGKDIFVPLRQRLSIFPTAKDAEFCKIASNALLATQVTAANELFKVSLLTGVNWQLVAQMLKKIDVIGKNIDVPGPDGQCGYGGKCLPKDISEACEMYRRVGATSYLFEEVVRTNRTNRAIPIRRAE
jgi:nucleotide sugar dehydrogenase